MFRPQYLFFIFVISILLSSCATEPAKVTKDQAAAFAIAIENEVRDMKINFLEKNIMLPVFMKRVYQAVDLKPSTVIESEMKKMIAGNSYEKNIYEVMAGKGGFKKVKQYEKEGIQHILYRVHGSGFTYLDMELNNFKEQVGIADIFLYNTGQNLSASVGDLMKKFTTHGQSAIANQLETRLTNISRYLKNANYEFAKAEFDRLPYDIRNNRLYEIRYMQILSKLGGEQYLNYQQKIETKYAADAGFQLMMIDLYLNQQKLDKALDAINKLDSFINKDPFLDYYRGLVLNMKGEPDEAIRHFEKLVAADPQLAEPYPELAAAYALQQDYSSSGRFFSLYKKMRNADKEIITYLKTSYPGLE